jgi:hypothetical protein
MGRIRRGEARDKDYDRLNKVGAKRHPDYAEPTEIWPTNAKVNAVNRQGLERLKDPPKRFEHATHVRPFKNIPDYISVDEVTHAWGGSAAARRTALEAIERLEPSLDIEEEQPHVLHWQTKKPSVAREEFGGHGVGSTTKGKGGKCFKCQQVGHWAAECPN